MVYSHSEFVILQKASHQVEVAVWEKHFLELVKDPIMPDPIESLRYVQKDGGRLFALAAGFRNALNQSHSLMSSGVRDSETELLGYQLIQSFEMVSQPTLYGTLEDFRRGRQEANGPEVVRSRRILARLRYHDDRQSETGV